MLTLQSRVVLLLSSQFPVQLLDLVTLGLKLTLLRLNVLTKLINLPLRLVLRVTFLGQDILIFIDCLLHLLHPLCLVGFLAPLTFYVAFVLLNQSFLLLYDQVLFSDDAVQAVFLASEPLDLLVLITKGHLALHLVTLELLQLLLQLDSFQ